MLYLKDGHRELDAVIFDLGNVLLDYSPRRFMGEMGVAPDLHERLFAVLGGSPEWANLDRNTMHHADLAKVASRKEPALKREIRQYLAHWAENFHAIPRNIETFYRVKEAGAKTYILSNFSEEIWKQIYPCNAFLDDFDGRILSFEHGVIKPEPEIYKLLIDTYSLDPKRSVFFDDMAVNVTGAVVAGLLAVQLPPCGDIAEYLEFED